MKSKGERWSVRRVTRLGFLTSVGTALFVLESLIPLPLPFLKIGLANISTLIALAISGPADAIIVVFLRVLAGSLITGSFLGPAFVLAMAAGLTSAAAMSLLHGLTGRLFSPVGISLVGSATHVITQLAIVSAIYVRNAAVTQFLPLLLMTAILGGLVVGLVTLRLLPVMYSHGGPPDGNKARFRTRLGAADAFVIVALAGAMTASFILPPDEAGTSVLVEVDGQTVGKLSLLEDAQLRVRGAKGDLHIEVRQGRVRVVDADCPNQICVRTGWRMRQGEVIVCVPNKTVVRILGGNVNTVGGITG
ncbi:MAG TPA: Gx transporter family protein [Bacteroidota bacterium]|nr:Gx transporter family protein [Bacteroidota bacterium]